MPTIKTICVCGAGTMGSGIAQLTAQAGYITIQFDLSAAMLEKNREAIEKNLLWLSGKGKIDAATVAETLSRLVFTTAITDCVADLVIEAIVEKQDAKVDLFNQLAKVNRTDTIFATNTSSIAVSAIAAAVPNAERVAGMHFFNPAPLMKLVEVIHTEKTDPGVIDTITGLAVTLGKTAVVCKDAPGFIVNRVARHYYLEAMKLVEEGLADLQTVDTVMEASGFKMGPFKLMDLIGMDINYGVSQIVWEALGKPERLTPSPLQQQKVAAGELGRKTGKGFYEY